MNPVHEKLFNRDRTLVGQLLDFILNFKVCQLIYVQLTLEILMHFKHSFQLIVLADLM